MSDNEIRENIQDAEQAFIGYALSQLKLEDTGDNRERMLNVLDRYRSLKVISIDDAGIIHYEDHEIMEPWALRNALGLPA